MKVTSSAAAAASPENQTTNVVPFRPRASSVALGYCAQIEGGQTPAEKRILARVVKRCNVSEHGSRQHRVLPGELHTFEAVRTVAADLGVHRTTIWRALKPYMAAGIIEERQTSPQCRTFVFHAPPATADATADATAGATAHVIHVRDPQSDPQEDPTRAAADQEAPEVPRAREAEPSKQRPVNLDLDLDNVEHVGFASDPTENEIVRATGPAEMDFSRHRCPVCGHSWPFRYRDADTGHWVITSSTCGKCHETCDCEECADPDPDPDPDPLQCAFLHNRPGGRERCTSPARPGSVFCEWHAVNLGRPRCHQCQRLSDHCRCCFTCGATRRKDCTCTP